ncbi:hypothetical protein CZ771_09905 [Actinomycetales bacterium JB111]|nr:hypothetical protein CZ771_09905 [Actinomycetales bacterium JB111]
MVHAVVLAVPGRRRGGHGRGPGCLCGLGCGGGCRRGCGGGCGVGCGLGRGGGLRHGAVGLLGGHRPRLTARGTRGRTPLPHTSRHLGSERDSAEIVANRGVSMRCAEACAGRGEGESRPSSAGSGESGQPCWYGPGCAP